MGVFHSDISISICQRKLSKILILLSVVSGRSACGDGQSHDFIGNGDSHPLCGFLLLLLQRTARLLRSTCNLRLFTGSSCNGLSTAHGDAWLLPTLPTSPLLNVTDPSAKSRGGNSFDSSSLCTGRGGFPALQPCRACLTGSRFSFLQTA